MRKRLPIRPTRAAETALLSFGISVPVEALSLPSGLRAFLAAVAAAWLAVWAPDPVSADGNIKGKTPAEQVDAATGYRMSNYRSPVTLPLDGGKRVSLDQLDALVKGGAALVDVMPARAGYDPRTGRWRLVEQRDDIPSSIWLPNTGAGRLEARLDAYFTVSLRHLTAGNLDRPLIFYCMADCWMSWNAVKRAAGLGYRNINWYAEGTDGWLEAGRRLVRADPLPVPAQAGTN